MRIKLSDRKVKDKDGKEVVRKAPMTLSGYGVKKIVEEDGKIKNILGTVKIGSDGLEITKEMAKQEPYSQWLETGVCTVIKQVKK